MVVQLVGYLARCSVDPRDEKTADSKENHSAVQTAALTAEKTDKQWVGRWALKKVEHLAASMALNWAVMKVSQKVERKDMCSAEHWVATRVELMAAPTVFLKAATMEHM